MKLTFKRFLLEYDFKVPPSSYGYWITDEGKFIPVEEKVGHITIMKRYFGTEDILLKIFKSGWIRIVESPKIPEIYIQVFENVPREAFNALKVFIQSRKDKYYGQDIKILVDHINGKDEFQNLHKALLTVGQYT